MSASKKASYVSYLNRQGPSALGSKPIPEVTRDSWICILFITGCPQLSVGSHFRHDRCYGQYRTRRCPEAYWKLRRTCHEGSEWEVFLSGCGFRSRGEQNPKGSRSIESCIDFSIYSNCQAAKLNTKQINEDQLFDLIRNSSAKTGPPVSKLAKSDKSIKLETNPKTRAVLTEATRFVNEISTPELKIEKKPEHLASANQVVLSGKPVVKPVHKTPMLSNPVRSSCQLLVDKYKPITMKHIVGQHGDRSPANKLFAWLKNWDNNFKRGTPVPVLPRSLFSIHPFRVQEERGGG